MSLQYADPYQKVEREYATYHGEFFPTPFKICVCGITEMEPQNGHEKAPLLLSFRNDRRTLMYTISNWWERALFDRELRVRIEPYA